MIHRIDVSENFIQEMIVLMEAKQAALNREVMFSELPPTQIAIKQYENFRLGEYILLLKDQLKRSRRVILNEELQSEYLGMSAQKQQKQYLDQSKLYKEIE